MHIAILGRQSSLSLAELECIYGAEAITPVGKAALIESDAMDIQVLGGSLKLGRLVLELSGDWSRVSQAIAKHYQEAWQQVDHKITLGISVYGETPPTAGQIQALGLTLKKSRHHHSGSLRLIPNSQSALSTATSHHNKLGLSPNKIELLIVQANNGLTYLAESTGAQNITALAARDQARPKTDAFVGMLPPKLARMMINMTAAKPGSTILDPFCGTGTVLQESLLMGYRAYGSDLSEKMVDYTQINLEWLAGKYRSVGDFKVEQADAMKHIWQKPIEAVTCESYLGQPFSAPPSPAKLTEVRGNCNHIISSFLGNIHQQLAPGTHLTVAVPAWRDSQGRFTHLPLTHQLEELGYRRRALKHVRPDQLIYYREKQVVAREILLLERA